MLPIIGPFLAFKKRRADGSQLALPELWKTLDSLREHPDIVPDFLAMTPAPVRNDFLYPRHPQPETINLMLTAVKYMHVAILENKNRFMDIPGTNACLGIAIEDWLRAFCVLVFISRKTGQLFAARPSRVTAQPVLWGNSHEGHDATDGDNSDAQSRDSINAADAAAQINSTLAGEMTDSGAQGRDDDRAQSRMRFEITEERSEYDEYTQSLMWDW